MEVKDLEDEIEGLKTKLGLNADPEAEKIEALTDKVEKFIAPQKGRKHALFLLRELLNFQPESKGTSLNTGLKFLKKRRCAVQSLLSEEVFCRYEKAVKTKTRGEFYLALAL